MHQCCFCSTSWNWGSISSIYESYDDESNDDEPNDDESDDDEPNDDDEKSNDDGL